MKSHRDIKVVVVATGDYGMVLDDIVVPSLKAHHPFLQADDILGLVCKKSPDLAGCTNFAPYKELMFKRQQFYRDMVKKYRGQKLLFIDADVICVNPFIEELSQILDSCEFAMQQNYIAGIWGVNCTDRVVEFFENFVKYLESIPPEERQDGFPQFELGDFIEKYRTNNMLIVKELPEKYGFFTPDMVMYHAINGGKSAQQKMLLLMGAHHYWLKAKISNFEKVFLHDATENGEVIWDGFPDYPNERQDYLVPRSHPTLTWFAAFRHSQQEEVKQAAELPDGTVDWTFADHLKIHHDQLIQTLTMEPVVVYLKASWCDLAHTPRFALTMTMEQFLDYLGYENKEQYDKARSK